MKKNIVYTRCEGKIMEMVFGLTIELYNFRLKSRQMWPYHTGFHEFSSINPHYFSILTGLLHDRQKSKASPALLFNLCIWSKQFPLDLSVLRQQITFSISSNSWNKLKKKHLPFATGLWTERKCRLKFVSYPVLFPKDPHSFRSNNKSLRLFFFFSFCNKTKGKPIAVDASKIGCYVK